MKIEIKGSFVRDSKKQSVEIQLKIKEVLLEVEKAENLSQITNLKKMVGYRIKIGDFRIGFYSNDGVIIFSRVLHRKDIYNYFPE